MVMWGGDLLGAARPTSTGDFPLLVKFLDARENLSVQVHPSPEYARAHPGAHLKTECWHVLEAEPGAVIYKGVKPGATRRDFERALRAGEGIVDLLEAVPAVRGGCHTLPSGTVHALGAGVLVAEVQTPSDTTFRVYDWGRTGRALHVEDALECIAFGPAPPATSGGNFLSATEFFTIHNLEVRGAATISAGERCTVLIVIEGSVTIGVERRVAEPTGVGAGTTVVVPAEIAPWVRLSSTAPAILMEITCLEVR